LDVDLVFYLGELGSRKVNGDEDYLRVGTVFGLGEEIGGDEDGVGALVGNDLIS